VSDQIEIRGGAGEFEAAVIAVVLDHIAFEEKARKSGQDSDSNRLSPWVQALSFPPRARPAPSKRLG
jgi:hypothetical protein